MINSLRKFVAILVFLSTSTSKTSPQAFAVASVKAEHYDSPLVKMGSYGVASMVGYARMERKAHWASDVLAAALIGKFIGREIVHFNHDKRYEISMIAGGDTAGAQVTHTF